MERLSLIVRFSGSPIGFFNPVIPTQNFGQSRNPEGYLGTPPPSHNFNPESRPDFALKSWIPNPEPQIREIPHPENLLETRVLERWPPGWKWKKMTREQQEIDSTYHFWKQKQKKKRRIGHFRVPPGLCIITRLSAQPSLWYGNDMEADIKEASSRCYHWFCLRAFNYKLVKEIPCSRLS